jgi:hypothetical protein
MPSLKLIKRIAEILDYDVKLELVPKSA